MYRQACYYLYRNSRWQQTLFYPCGVKRGQEFLYSNTLPLHQLHIIKCEFNYEFRKMMMWCMKILLHRSKEKHPQVQIASVPKVRFNNTQQHSVKHVPWCDQLCASSRRQVCQSRRQSHAVETSQKRAWWYQCLETRTSRTEMSQVNIKLLGNAMRWMGPSCCPQGSRQRKERNIGGTEQESPNICPHFTSLSTEVKPLMKYPQVKQVESTDTADDRILRSKRNV